MSNGHVGRHLGKPGAFWDQRAWAERHRAATRARLPIGQDKPRLLSHPLSPLGKAQPASQRSSRVWAPQAPPLAATEMSLKGRQAQWVSTSAHVESSHRLRILRALLVRNPGIQPNPHRLWSSIPPAGGSGWILPHSLLGLPRRQGQRSAPLVHMVDGTMPMDPEDVQ